MKGKLEDEVENLILYSKNNIVIEVNQQFINITGYSKNELIGNSITNVSKMIRIDSQINLHDIEIDKKNNFYIFTKSIEAIEVIITCEITGKECEKKLIFKRILDLNKKECFSVFEQLYTDRKTGYAIISAPNFILLKANQNFFDFLVEPHNKKENSIGKKMNEIITKYDCGDDERAMINAMKYGRTYFAEEYEYKYFDMGVTYWNTSIVPMFSEKELKYFFMSFLEVTERVISRNAIEQKNKELEAVIENMADEVLIFDQNGQIININKALRNNHIFNFAKTRNPYDAYKQFNVYDLNGNLIPLEKIPAKRILNGESFSGYKLLIKGDEGSVYNEFSGSPIYDSKGNFVAGVIVSHDITEKEKYQNNLFIKAQYETLNKIIKNLGLGFLRISYKDHKIIDINNMFYDILKQSNLKLGFLLDIIGKDIRECLTHDNCSMYIKNIQYDLKNKESVTTSINKYIMYGEEKYYKIVLHPLYKLNKDIAELIVICFDVTNEIKEKNKAEETLKKEEEFFINITHELKTPLNVIFSANQLMDLYLRNDSIFSNKDVIKRNNNMIRQNCYRLTKLINNIVDLSKIESGFLKLNLTNNNIVEVVENIVQSISEYIKNKGLSIIFYSDVEEKNIAFDVDKIERVVLNLISNAIKFTDEGTKIYINVLDKGEFIEISVKDYGIGIEKEHLNSIFNRFQQVDKTLSRNAEGSGIGLSLVKSIVEMHDGEISVESELGKGSKFRIKLPVKIVQQSKCIEQNKFLNNKIEMINVEFSDIYSILD